jgi:hypothetical protein
MIDTVTEETATKPVKPVKKPARAIAAKAPAPTPVTRSAAPSEGLAKLRVGDTFLRENVTYAVYFINESRACIAPIDDLSEYRKSDDGMIKFAVPAGKTSENIGPNSDLEITASLGREGLAQYIDERKARIEAEKPAPKTKPIKPAKPAKAAKTPGVAGIRSGSLGNYKGYSIASVIRTLATKGWNFAEIRAFLDKVKIESSDQTIKLNIYRGVNKTNSALAPLTPADMPAKPVIEAKEKPAKKAKAEKAEKPAAKPAAKPVTAKAAPAPAVVKKPAPGDRAAAQIAALKAAKLAKIAAGKA